MSSKISSKKNEESEIKSLISKLNNRDGEIRSNARKSLKLFGHKVVVYLSELLLNRKKIIRWEAAKTLLDIRDPYSGPLFILAIKDKSPDIRWIGAEGLISLGKSGVIIMLEGLISNPGSLFIRKGAHHVLKEYSKYKPSSELKRLLTSLNRSDPNLFSPIVALILLRKLKDETYRNN